MEDGGNMYSFMRLLSLHFPLQVGKQRGILNKNGCEVFPMDCIFCAIAKGEIPSSKVYEDDYMLAFRDIAPQAPTHILVIPKSHIPSLDAVTEENCDMVAKILAAIPKIAAKEGLVNGYRVITNIGDDGCQSVKHLHFHILGGTKLSEQMA
jgi:histidine triad (HIT) family protein